MKYYDCCESITGKLRGKAMWGGILRKVALLGWLIEGVHSDVALKTRYLAAAASKAAEVSEATVVLKAMTVSRGMVMSKAKAVSKATVELKAAAATSEMATAVAICKGKSARVLVGRWLGANLDCPRGP
jgi:hypothetical protein